MGTGELGKKLRQVPFYRFLLVLIAGTLLYGIFGNLVYLEYKKLQLMGMYKNLCQADFARLEEEEEEILEEFPSEHVEVLITDGDDNLIFVDSRWQNSPKEDLTGYRDRYSEKPTVHCRAVMGHYVLRLRGIVWQKDTPYYIYLRKEIVDSRELIRISLFYFVFVLAVAMAARAGMRKKRAVSAGQTAVSRIETAAGAGQLEQAQKEFVANVSHELKTPLAVISGQVEMLQTMGDSIDRDYYFSSIREEIDKMSEMVGELLDISILEHKMETMEKSEVDLHEMMQYLLLKHEALFQKNKIKLESHLDENCTVYGNRMYLEQAVGNYIMNAFQNTKQGNRMKIELKKSAGAVKINVYNEGSHIDEEEKDLIWMGFYGKSGDERAKNEKMKNAGLGLWLVKKVAEQHGGSCGAENTRDGVNFWIKLPLFSGVQE